MRPTWRLHRIGTVPASLEGVRRGQTIAGLIAIWGLLCLVNCGGTGSGSEGGSSSSEGGSTIQVTPGSVSVLLGDSVTFAVRDGSGENVAVVWSANGIPGGNSTEGIISKSGQYTAPGILPASDAIQISATAKNDSSQSGSASITLSSGISIDLSPLSVDLPFGATQEFSAQVQSDGHPDLALRWSVDGVTGGNASVGTIQAASVGANDGSTATYTAPSTDPSDTSVNVTVISVADPSKSAKAVVTLKCKDGISPAAAGVLLSQSLELTATWCNGPSTATTWTVNGSAGNSAIGKISATGKNSAKYTAPADLPSPQTIAIRAENEGYSLNATVTVESSVAVSISPSSAVVALGGRVTLTPTVTGSSDAALTWRVNGVSGGNAASGKLCALGSNPCVPVAGQVSGAVDYLPPSTVPSPATVSVSVISRADLSRGATAAITIISAGTGTITVAVSPQYSFLPPAGTQQFNASVAGTNNSGVQWSIETINGGCAGTACGTVSQSGLYTAPNNAPSPNSITIQAVSTADPSSSGIASIVINSGPNIQQLLPSSVMAGVASSFTLAVVGAGFSASTGPSASTILINGSPRNTVCQTTLRCTITLQPGDVSAAGNLTVQIQNPGPTGAFSNAVPLVIVPFTLNEAVIPLTISQPESDANNISVFEPTTAGVTASQINVDYAGPITGGSTCNFDSSPIEIARPSTGSSAPSICVHGNTLDPSFFYEFSGPATPDISVSPVSLASILSNLVQLNLTITSSTTTGVRSLFITTPNNDKAVATGLLEVQ